jgi:histidinol phosphatase-like PHP family hydrolase
MSKRAQRMDFHTHSFFSDGVLLPSELIARAVAQHHRAIAITDHADSSNLEPIAESILRFVEVQGNDWPIRVLAGVELTHVLPHRIGRLAQQAKEMGLSIVVVHGETIVEPVVSGTNQAAVECPYVDILAHPGFITLRDAKQAAQNGVHLEITSRHGHSLTNGHVAWVARQTEARLLLNTDTHTPSELIDLPFARQVGAGAGLTQMEVEMATVTNPSALLARILQRTSGASGSQLADTAEGAQ